MKKGEEVNYTKDGRSNQYWRFKL